MSQNKIPPAKTAPQHSAKEIITIICFGLLLIFCAYTTISAVSDYKNQHYFDCLENVGVLTMVISGYADPINAVWQLLPIGFHTIGKAKPYNRIQKSLLSFGFFMFVIGLAGSLFG